MAVYFIAEEGTERVKIGCSQYPWRRLQELQAKNDKPLVLLRVVAGIDSDERRMHRAFAHLRIEGEWFTYSDEMFDVAATRDISAETRAEAASGATMTDIELAGIATSAQDDARDGTRKVSALWWALPCALAWAALIWWAL